VSLFSLRLAADISPLQKEDKKDMDTDKVMIARYTETPIRIDGSLDDEAWSDAEVYPMSLSKDRIADGQTLIEGGEIRLAWDAQYFYVGARFVDSDIVAESDEDQKHHYKFGDLVELFLKPEDQTWYWELYATPRGNKTSFWFPGRGRLGLPSSFDYECGLVVAANVDGTLNDWRDRDKEWTAEMAMPVKDLVAPGGSFGPNAPWRILVARYNYSRYLPKMEQSMSPALERTNFHLYEQYGELRLEK
jgi:hypothetical protein